MEVAVIGLPQSGKTTVFEAATSGRVQASARPGRPAVGTAKVSDPRLLELARIGGSARIVEAEVAYLDIAQTREGSGNGMGIGGEMLTHLQSASALALVARAFVDPSVPHVLNRIDPASDVAEMLDELALVDLSIIERRLHRMEVGLKGAKTSEHGSFQRERALLGRLSADLENGLRVADASLSYDERKIVSGFGLLTAKPLIVVANLDDSQVDEAAAVIAGIESALPQGDSRTVGVFGRAEVELSTMAADDAAEIREGMEMGESGLSKMVRACLEAMGLITFFTVGPKEARAWAVADRACAVDGAAAIHTDMARGFIRAEVASFSDFVASGGETGAKRKGLLRSEGRDYELRDGDVVHILFNV